MLRGTELLDDPQVLARGLIAETPTGPRPSSPFAIDGSRAPADARAPALGEHTQAWVDALRGPQTHSRAFEERAR